MPDGTQLDVMEDSFKVDGTTYTVDLTTPPPNDGNKNNDHIVIIVVVVVIVVLGVALLSSYVYCQKESRSKGRLEEIVALVCQFLL